MSACFTNSLTPPTGLGLLVALRGRSSFAVGQRVGSVVPSKMACRPAAGGHAVTVQGHQLAHRGGAARSLPLSNREREWTPRRATLLCWAGCRSSAVVLRGSREARGGGRLGQIQMAVAAADRPEAKLR